MHTVHGEVATQSASRVMRRLCKHWSHKYPVEGDDVNGVIQLPTVRCVMKAHPDKLEVSLETEDEAVLPRMQGVVAEHLQRMASGEPFEVRWA